MKILLNDTRAVRAVHTRSTSRRALIIFPGALGDLICAVPSIRAIERHNPEVSFELMARGDLARFSVGRFGITRGHSIDRPEVAHLFSEHAQPTERARAFFVAFHSVHSFFAADHRGFRQALSTILAGNVRFYPFRPAAEGHVSLCYLRAIGAQPVAPLYEDIELLPNDLESASTALKGRGFDASRILLILPGSGNRSKNWPAERFAELTERVRPLCSPLLVCGPAEEGLERMFVERGLETLSGIDLGGLAGLARIAGCFVGNDSGVSHLAAATGCRGIVIFGPTDPVRWRPLGQVKIIRRQPIEALEVDELFAALAAELA